MAEANPFRPMHLHMVRDRHLVFTTDLVFFVNSEAQTGWMPVGSSHYFTPPLSPFTADMGEAIKVILRRRDRDFRSKFEHLIQELTLEEKVFSDHCKTMFYQLFSTRASVAQFFEGMVYLARMSVLFYQRGISEAPNLAVVMMGDALYQYNLLEGAGLFNSFTVVAAGILAEQEPA